MPTDDTKSVESNFIEAFVLNSSLRAKIEEARLEDYREIKETLERMTMFLMRDAADGAERSGATDRLNVVSLEIARLQAALSKMSEQVTKFMVRFDTLQRELIRRESLPERMWRWYVARAERGKE